MSNKHPVLQFAKSPLYPSEDIVIPEYKSEGAIAFDISSCVDMILKPCMEVTKTNALSGDMFAIGEFNKPYMVPTGLIPVIPKGYGLKIYLRSSIGVKTHLMLTNHVGLIDEDYRGEIKLLLRNIGLFEFHIHVGDRICQGELVSVPKPTIKEVDFYDVCNTARGDNGFGSTGMNK